MDSSSSNRTDGGNNKSSDSGFIELTDPKLMIRLLYTNPVSLLTVASKNRAGKPNTMTISWLTAVNNDALFMFSINRRRFTLSMLVDGMIDDDKSDGLLPECGKQFTLSIPTAENAKDVLQIGGKSGRNVQNKLDETQFSYCTAGGGIRSDVSSANAGNDEPALVAILESAAHLECEIVSSSLSPAKIDSEEHHQCKSKNKTFSQQHVVCFAKINKAHVRENYWVQRKLFAPKTIGTSPFLTFLGAQQFGFTVSQDQFETTLLEASALRADNEKLKKQVEQLQYEALHRK
jgi:flavin reductase (DIM6/NTAB) family NADH-FMN oxidoreductase RutF